MKRNKSAHFGRAVVKFRINIAAVMAMKTSNPQYSLLSIVKYTCKLNYLSTVTITETSQLKNNK